MNLHENESKTLLNYTSYFELNGLMDIGRFEHKTIIRFTKMDDFESYLNAIDVDSDSEDATFTRYVFKLNTPQFNVVKRSAYSKITKFMQEIVEYHGQNV